MAEKRIDWTSDEVILVAAKVMANNWRGFGASSDLARNLSTLLRSAPFHPPADRGEKFRNPNGVARKSADIATYHPSYLGSQTKGGKTDRAVLRQFLNDPTGMNLQAERIEAAIRSGQAEEVTVEDEEDDVDDDAAAAEGRLLLVLHRRRERDPKLRRKKIASVLAAGKPIACEVCHFNFGTIYGERGAGYIEVHHVLPLHASGETTTKLADLALLCSNCHRMIHRKRPWITPSQLRWVVAHPSLG